MAYARTALLLAGLTALFMTVGYLIGGGTGMMMALAVAAGLNILSYWNSDRMVLGLYGAEPVDEASAPGLHAMTAKLATRAGLPMPKLYVIDNPQPNAFATGRNPENAAVAINTGLLQSLTAEEAEGVIAHELAHIKNRDTLLMTVTATIAGAVSMLSNMAMFFPGSRREGNGGIGALGAILMAVLAPLGAMLVQMAISRTREYEADRVGAAISGRPLALASALAKLADAAHLIPNQTAEMNPATAHLFIVNPLSGARMDNLFSTHPDPANRIAALETMAGQMDMTAPSKRSAPRLGSSDLGRPRGPWG